MHGSMSYVPGRSQIRVGACHPLYGHLENQSAVRRNEKAWDAYPENRGLLFSDVRNLNRSNREAPNVIPERRRAMRPSGEFATSCHMFSLYC
jgi:hypothetical protein